MIFIREIWNLLNEMAPYLLLGFSIAGILHVIVPESLLYKHLSKNKLSSIVKAAVFGVPIPLCSCSVIPVAQHLHKKGASRGAVISFLSSAPTTGVDSMLATYSLMGPVFAIFRPLSAFVIGVLSGIFVNVGEKQTEHVQKGKFENFHFSLSLPWKQKFKNFIKYGFWDLPSDIAKWFLIGIISGALISIIVPSDFPLITSPILSYAAMLLIGIPMYVCATGSIPIAASLLAKGISPGAALVFLISGPATNTATISFVIGSFGKKVTLIYVATIMLISVIFGIALDLIISKYTLETIHHHHSSEMLPMWFKTTSAIALLIMMIVPHIYQKYFAPKEKKCPHCH